MDRFSRTMSWLWWWSAPSRAMVVEWSSQSPGLNQHTILSFVVQDPCSRKMSTLFSQATLWCLEASKQWGVETLHLLFFYLALHFLFLFKQFFALLSDPLLSDSRDVSHYKRVCLGCHTPGSWSGNCQKRVWTPPLHPEATCYQMLILIWLRPTFLGRTSSGFCFRKPPLHFHHRPVLTH